MGMHRPCTLYPKYYGYTSSPCTRIYFSENFLGLVPVVFVRSGSKEKWEERLRRKCRVCKVHTIVVNSTHLSEIVKLIIKPFYRTIETTAFTNYIYRTPTYIPEIPTYRSEVLTY